CGCNASRRILRIYRAGKADRTATSQIKQHVLFGREFVLPLGHELVHFGEHALVLIFVGDRPRLHSRKQPTVLPSIEITRIKRKEYLGIGLRSVSRRGTAWDRCT